VSVKQIDIVTTEYNSEVQAFLHSRYKANLSHLTIRKVYSSYICRSSTVVIELTLANVLLSNRLE